MDWDGRIQTTLSNNWPERYGCGHGCRGPCTCPNCDCQPSIRHINGREGFHPFRWRRNLPWIGYRPWRRHPHVTHYNYHRYLHPYHQQMWCPICGGYHDRYVHGYGIW